MDTQTAYLATMVGMIGGAGEANRFLDEQGHRMLLGGSEVKLPLPDPSKPRATLHNDTRLVLEHFGVRFGERDPKFDRLMVRATLPAGWSVKPTDHHMYSDLLDERGRKRAVIGYKYMDGWTTLYAVHRLRSTYLRDDWSDREGPTVPVIENSNGQTLWRGPMIVETKAQRTRRENRRKEALEKARESGTDYSHEVIWNQFPDPTDRARTLAANRLFELYPEHGSLAAYWDRDDLAFPAWESEAPKGEPCRFFIQIYRDREGRNYVDGGHQNTLVLDGDAAVEAKLTQMIERASHLRSYGRVDWKVERDGQTVATRSVVAPPAKDEWVCTKDKFFGYDDFSYPPFRTGRS